MNYFSDDAVRLDVLKQRAYNLRWAEVEEGVLPLTAADPDFPVAPAIINAMKDYLDGGYLSYTPKLGLPELRSAFARKVSQRKNEPIRADLVLPIDSAARGMYVAAAAALQPGDEMIVFDPVDFLFGEACLAAGGSVVRFPARLNAEGGIDLSALESYITPKTRMIGLCNPHNPLGTLYTREDLEHILSLANKYDLYIMNDEIWSDIVYTDQPFLSINDPAVQGDKSKIISVYGFSKAFGIAGLRLGCVYCLDEALFEQVLQRSDVLTTAGGIASLSQVAGVAALEQAYPWVDAFRAHLQENRDYAMSRMARMPHIRCTAPRATYLLFPDITATGMDSASFSDFVLQEEKLAIVPGTAQFFGPGAEGHVRICFATSRAILTDGMDRLERALRKI